VYQLYQLISFLFIAILLDMPAAVELMLLVLSGEQLTVEIIGLLSD
jgi:hypothetical protein